MTDEDHEGDRADIAACTPNATIYAAAGLLALAGFALVFLAMQTWALLGPGRSPVVGVALAFMLLGGATLIALGSKALGMRIWACVMGSATAGLLGALELAWFVFSTSRGLISLLGFGASVACFLAAVVSALAVRVCERADEARSRLDRRGLRLGL